MNKRQILFALASLATLVSCDANSLSIPEISSFSSEPSSSSSTESISSESKSSSESQSIPSRGSKSSSDATSNSESSSESSQSSEESSSSSVSESSFSESSSSSSIESSSSSESSSLSSESSQSSEESSSSSSEQSSSEESSSSSSESSISSSSEEQSYWDVDFAEYGEDFLITLADQINEKVKKTTTYSMCKSIGAKAAAYPERSSATFIPFYHDESTYVKPDSKVNREHTWPDSRGGGMFETDPFMVRPTLMSDNSSRGNNFYGLGGSSKKEWDPASCGFEGARGESARVIFYCATKYYEKGVYLTNNPSDDWTKIKTMGTLSTLVKWNAEYPVTENEKRINDYLYTQGYGRNPFVDHPEYVDYIWDIYGFLDRPLYGTDAVSYSNDTKMDDYDLVDAAKDVNDLLSLLNENPCKSELF